MTEAQQGFRDREIPDDVDALADEIAELAAHVDAATHRQLACLRRFDAREGWARHGALTCAHWLSWRTGLDLGAARQKVRVARKLGELSLMDDALRRGELSYAKVRAMTRVATKENEATLLELARYSTAPQLERLCRKFRQVVRTQVKLELDPEDDDRWVRTRDTECGMVRLQAQLRPEEAALVMKALEAAQGTIGVSTEPRTRPFNKADALVGVAETFLARGSDGSNVSGRFEVALHVDAPALEKNAEHEPEHCELEDGTPVSRETARQLACDAPVMDVREDGTVGPRTRTIPAALRRALRLRDGGCTFPGCTNKIFVDAHHIEHWADGGETTLENLTETCRRHHRLVHEGGFRVERLADGSVAFHDPRGRRVEAVPPRPELPPDAVAALAETHRAAGIKIEPETNYPAWVGEPMDYALAVDALIDVTDQPDVPERMSQR